MIILPIGLTVAVFVADVLGYRRTAQALIGLAILATVIVVLA